MFRPELKPESVSAACYWESSFIEGLLPLRSACLVTPFRASLTEGFMLTLDAGGYSEGTETH